MEILVALSMLILILAAVYGSYTAATTSVARCKPKSILEQQARLFLQRITSELRCYYAGRPSGSIESSFQRAPARETVQQDEAPLFVNKDVSSRQTLLQLITPAVASRQNHNVGGLVIVSYRLDESKTALLRSERRYVDRLDNDDEDCTWLPVLANVKTIAFEYFDGSEWQDEWDRHDMSGPPQAVRITLVLETEDTGPLSFVSVAHVTCRGHPSPAVAVQNIATPPQDLLDGKKRSQSQ